jgi:hypothetical protein
MTIPNESCAVCGFSEPAGGEMSRLVIEGRSLCLCRTHAAVVATEMPETFEDMRTLFIGISLDRAASEERRSPISRRDPEDRRVFPPRIEGRRKSFGRRTDDAAE